MNFACLELPFLTDSSKHNSNRSNIKRLLIILLVSILAVCSMAQEPSVHHNGQVLWVIDGLVMDTTTMTRGEKQRLDDRLRQPRQRNKGFSHTIYLSITTN